MPGPSLATPLLIEGRQPEPGTLHFEPTHIGTWSSSSKAGPSRRIALAAPDNTIWVYPYSDDKLLDKRWDSSLPRYGRDIPEIRARSPTPAATPQPTRPVNPRVSSFSNRSRAPSNASSTRTSSSRHRITSFSPPTTAQPVTTTLSPATATASASDGHARWNSLSERAELMEHLREQQARSSEEGRSHVGLGINFGRKVEAQGQVDHDKASGTTSPKSAKSNDSQQTSLGGRLMGWATGADSGDERTKKELDQHVAEIAVDREMEQETERDARQEEEMKTIEDAIARASPTKSPASGPTVEPTRADAVRRIILKDPGRGKIVSMEAYEELGLLCVLRDIGSLEIFSLSDLSQTSSINLEEPERRGEAGPSKERLHLTPFWQWRSMHLAHVNSSPILALDGLPWSCGQPSHNGDVTRVVLMSFSTKGGGIIESRLDLPGQGSIGLANNGDNTFLLHSTQTSLTSYTISRGHTLSTERPPHPSSSTGVKQSRAISSAHPPAQRHIEAPSDAVDQPLLRSSRSVASLRDAQSSSPAEHKSFAKFLAAKKADWRGEKPEKEGPKDANTLQVGEGREVERDGGGSWDRIVLQPNGDGVGVVNDAIDAFTCDGTKMRILKTITLDPGQDIQDVVFPGGHAKVCVSTRVGVHTYGRTTDSGDRYDYSLKTQRTSAIPSAIKMDNASRLWTAGADGLALHAAGLGVSDPSVVLRGTQEEDAKTSPTHITTSTGHKVWTADADGNLLRRTLSDVIEGSHPTDEELPPHMDRMASTVTCVRTCSLGPRRYLVAGDEDGAVRIWDETTAHLLASWTLFADHVRSIALIDMSGAGVLQDHLVCVSEEGTIGVISLTQMEHLYLIPASRGPLRRIFVSGTDILLAYANGKARLWNVETMEFRRSTGLDAADDMLTSGPSWKEVLLDVSGNASSGALSSLSASTPTGSNLGRALVCNPRNIGSELRSLPTPHGLAMLSGLLSLFVTFGLDGGIDEVCRSRLGVVVPEYPIFVGAQSGAGSVLSYACGRQAWQQSAYETGLRQLVILSLLRPFLDSKEHESYAIQAIAFYATGLPDDIVPAELDFFASFYLDPSGDVQQAARMLFNATLDRMSEEDLEVLVSQHQPRLHTIGSRSVSTPAKDDGAHSLLMIGAIALHKYQSVNPTALKSVAESILAILKDPSSQHLALAIELCSKGYTIWQTFADPMDLLRQLFHLSTRKDASTVNAQARLAVLHVASSNPALFMSTLSMDILNAESAEGRNSIMKLCVYMARKKPEVLENGLPRIAEAVVKSLDPNIGKMREDVWQAATVILNELVLAFSTIDFHSGTQKLAVGTHEGAVIMYELKTASRLYVLEPHHSPVSSVTFSPDGRRLLTVSLEEGLVTVWKVGSSLSGFFNVGGPPRQGALGGTGPFKRIPFARLEEGPPRSTSALSDVHVSWPGPKQAKVMVGETAMTFET